ncbi:hypothetical protein MtrunA17_Chr8g0351781 [Medicago truncatula]|uniref:Uncharacterized protein n=1 Tax=Medicago truncatula TaxID=3880 RepID=A0A396GHX0_MEDTR|nr:hypothetical protein MtrunA17_Chr8g0351781 [Medicago truncatula]
MLYVSLYFHPFTKCLLRVMIVYFCNSSTWLMFLESEKHFPSLHVS